MTATGDVTRERLQRALDGKYTIRRAAGVGGMAVVYEALDHRYNRTVAIKVLHEDLTSASGTSRFLREISIAAQLNHPHILPVLDSGQAGGLLYFVMPFVHGETLRERMRREPQLSLSEVLRIARGVALALAYAHEKGVIHRDLKPENIMLAEGVPVVTDFGIARAFEIGGAEALTSSGMVIGTPSYMSPEQATGAQSVDGRSDTYGLGCILFEMLAQHAPYRGGTALSILTQHASAAIPSVKVARADIPDDLSAAIARAMAKAPKDRFATITAFADALDAASSGVVTLTPRVGLPSLPQFNWRPYVIGVVGLCLAGGMWAFRSARTRRAVGGAPPVVAVLPFEHLGPAEDAYITEGMSDEVSSRIADVGGISVISRSSAMQFDLRKQKLADIARDLNADFLVVGSIRIDHPQAGASLIRVTPRVIRVSDGSAIWNDRYDAELQPGKMFEVQSRIARSVAEALHVTMSPESRTLLQRNQTSSLDAYRYFLQGNLHLAQFLVRDQQALAINMYERAVAIDSNFALAYARLAQANATYFSLYDRTPARLKRLQAAVERANLLAPRDVEVGVARGYLAHFGQRNLAAAMQEYTAARARQPNNAPLLWVIGFVQRQQGDMTNAVKSFRAASALDPRSAMLLFEVSTVAFIERRPDEALTTLGSVLDLSPEFLPAQVGKASILFYAGRFREAEQAFEELGGIGDRVVPYLIGEPIFRAVWTNVVPDTMVYALSKLSLRTPGVDSVGYYHAKGAVASIKSHPEIARSYFDSLRTLVRARALLRPNETTEFLYLSVADLELNDSLGSRQALDSLMARDPLKRDAFRGGFILLDAARVYARLGLRDQAIAVLERLARVPSPSSPQLLAADPAFASLRSDPRFKPLIGLRP